MNLEIKKYVRKPFYVEAVTVTEDNIVDVAMWCGGKLVPSDGTVNQYIKVPVDYPMTGRQTKAFVGDLVLKALRDRGGFKVYTDVAFHRSFEGVDDDVE